MKTLFFLLILSLSNISMAQAKLCEAEKEAFKKAKSQAKSDCKSLKGKEKRACKFDLTNEAKANYKSCRKKSRVKRKQLQCEKKIKKNKLYKWDESKGRCLKQKKSSCNKIEKLFKSSKLKNTDKWQKLIEAGSCTKLDLKEAKCESRGKEWIEKRKGRFSCVKKSKVINIKQVKLAMDPIKDKVKFMKCKKYWIRIRKRISGKYIKVKHFTKLVKKGCIAEK